MDRILEYMSQQSWDSQRNSQAAEDATAESQFNNECIPEPLDQLGIDIDRIFANSEELIMTPESEDEAESDDESSVVSYSQTPPAPTYSPITPPLLDEYEDQDEDDFEEENCESDDDASLNWDWITGDSFAETNPLHFTGQSSFIDAPDGEDIELKCFQEFLTDEIIELIVKESNNYYEELKRKTTQRSSRRLREYKYIEKEDILRLIAVRICMGVDQKPTQANYWCNSPFYKSEIVPLIMTSDRYKDVHRFLHFCKNNEQKPGDRLHKIREVWGLFNERHGLNCTPGKNICIDESLVLFKGNLIIKQYIPSKAAKVGIKLFSVCDSESGYLLSSLIYEGKGHKLEKSAKDFGFGGALALELSARYLNAGRCLYMDNYFVNARVAKELLSLNTNICGTLRKRLKCNPVMDNKLKKNNVCVYSCNGIMVERWRDRRDVCILSTGHCHNRVTVRTRGGKEQQKPESVLAYNKYSKSIDTMDTVTGTYDMNRRCTKWYKKLFFKMLEICLYNAKIIFSKKHGVISMLDFKERIVLQILRRFGEHSVKRGRKSSKLQGRFTERHFLKYIPATQKNFRPSRDCVICRSKNKRKQTRFMCPDCSVALCVVPCFKAYHTR